MVFLKEVFEKVDFEKTQQTTKKHEKFPKAQRVKTASKTSAGSQFTSNIELYFRPPDKSA